jgi:hypothetical protein
LLVVPNITAAEETMELLGRVAGVSSGAGLRDLTRPDRRGNSTFQIRRGGEKGLGRRGRFLEELGWIVVGARRDGNSMDLRFREAEHCSSRSFGFEAKRIGLR